MGQVASCQSVFETRPVNVGFVGAKVALGHTLLYPVMLHTNTFTSDHRQQLTALQHHRYRLRRDAPCVSAAAARDWSGAAACSENTLLGLKALRDENDKQDTSKRGEPVTQRHSITSQKN